MKLRAKLIVPPALAPGTQTYPWLVIAGDPGIARHFLAGAEQSSGPFFLYQNRNTDTLWYIKKKLKQLKDLDPKKAVGMDGLSSKLLKLAAPAIASIVTKVINLSIKASKFATLWKLARVYPIF